MYNVLHICTGHKSCQIQFSFFQKKNFKFSEFYKFGFHFQDIFSFNKIYFCKYQPNLAQVLMCNFRYVATICSLNETWVTISCFRTQGARSTCFFYKGKPVSFYGFSYNGRKTLCKLRVVSSGQAGYNGCWCACLPTCHLGRAW